MPSPQVVSADRRATLLHASAHFTQCLTAALSFDELLRQVVDTVCDEFGFYYAGVFLLDEVGRWAILRAGRGEVGATLVANGHKLAVGGESMIGAATGRSEPRVALDVTTEPLFFKNPHLPYTRSEVALPLVVGGELLGALTVQSQEVAAFGGDDIAALQALADQLAVAIKNNRLHSQNQSLLRQAQRRARLLIAANEVGHKATAILDLGELLPKTVDIICEAYRFYYAGVFLIDETGLWAALRAGRGEAGAAMLVEGHKLAVGGDSMIGTAIAQREARIALDVGEEAVFFKNPHLPYTRSEMALPLIVGDQALGAVTVQSVEERAFSSDDITTLQTMADHLAIAIHNAQLLQKLERAYGDLLRTKTYEALATATTQAIHWIGNKALPITSTVARLQSDLGTNHVDVQSLREDLDMIAESAQLIVAVKENLIGPALERMPRPALLADVTQAAAYHAGVPPHQLSIETASHTPLALVDTTQLARVFGNLFKNALEASAQHIWVTIEPAAEPGYLSVRIADDGKGIATEHLDKVWAAFFTTKGSQHSGLGLPTCLHVITQLNGRIALDSRPGYGTTFTILLPAADEPAQTVLSAAPASVLLIDDDDPWARFVTNALAATGKRVMHHTSINKTADADLIVLDETLTAAPTADVLATLKAAGVVDKAIVVSAAMNVERTTAYLKAGAKDVVLKPYTLNELAELLA